MHIEDSCDFSAHIVFIIIIININTIRVSFPFLLINVPALA